MANFDSDLKVGELGVRLACAVLRRYGSVKRVEDDRYMQQRGIDIISDTLGYVEIKTDSHTPDRVFFELSSNGQPGAVDRSVADNFCIIFYKYNTMLIISRPHLQQFLRENIAHWLDRWPKWFITTRSSRGGNGWCSTGVLVPITVLIGKLGNRVTQLTWNEEEEVFSSEQNRDSNREN